MDISQLDEILVATVVLIFSLSLAAAVVRRLAKDKCLKLMHDHHVTYLPTAGPIIWGDMQVRSRGFEIVFDSPFINSRDMAKTGSLVRRRSRNRDRQRQGTAARLSVSAGARHRSQPDRGENGGLPPTSACRTALSPTPAPCENGPAVPLFCVLGLAPRAVRARRRSRPAPEKPAWPAPPAWPKQSLSAGSRRAAGPPRRRR